MITAGLAALGAIATGLATNYIWEATRPKNPTAIDYICMYAPQAVLLIVIVGLFIMYKSIIKKYKVKKIFLLYPLLITIVYHIFLLITNIFSGLPVLKYGLYVVLSIFYIRDVMEVNSGNHKFENLKPLTIISEFFK